MLVTLIVVPCAWCTPPQAGDRDATHGVCEMHAQMLLLEQQRRREAREQLYRDTVAEFYAVPSYVCERSAFEAYKVMIQC